MDGDGGAVSGNPLLDRGFLVPFDRIEPGDVAPAVDETLKWARRRLDEAAADETASGGAALAGIDAVAQEVARTWAPVSHLANVAATPELRRAHAAALPEVVRFRSRLFHHEKLYRRLQAFAASREGRALAGLPRRHLEKTLREFRRAGADLSRDRKAALEEMRVELSELGRSFEENLLEETAAYGKLVTDRDALAGLPEAVIERASRLAEARGQEGWLVTLDMPSVDAVLRHASDRSLRREVHAAYLDRCTGGERDNRPLIARMLELRRRIASLLGYDDFPSYRLETAMAKSGGRVRTFLDELIAATRPFHDQDAQELQRCARRFGVGALAPWDVSFLMEKLRKERFDLDDEALRPWFPLDEVQSGLFEIARRLFGLSVKRADNPAVWHPDVCFFEVRDDTGRHLGSFYADWFPRDTKRQGAWMDALVAGGPRAGAVDPRAGGPAGEGFDPHLGFVGGNFNPPTKAGPSLLTHREVRTLFHEFGHLLHHVASRVEIPERGGTNVAWDWVEVPSQIMENWTWRSEALDIFARHHETGAPLPADTVDRLIAARRFMGGWSQMRQLSLANLDLELHRSWDAETPVMEYAAATLRPFVPSDRFVERHVLPSFAHLFGGGYASAYYSYLWSETLEADAFSRFEDEGVLSPVAGRAFLDSILSQGDRREPDELFRAFMGRAPNTRALIQRNLGTTFQGDGPSRTPDAPSRPSAVRQRRERG